MKNLALYLAFALCLLVGKTVAQETFSAKAKAIADKIEKITNGEKEALKVEVEEVNKQLENGKITMEQADKKKKDLAEARAIAIENKVNAAKEELNTLIQEKVDGRMKENKGKNTFSFNFNTKDDSLNVKSESRLTTQGVFAAGWNNVVTDGAVANSDFSYGRSSFMEWGMTWNYRLTKQSNLLHFKYGFSWMYNHLNATDNRYFVVDGDQTVLATYPTHLRRKDTI
jgi:hypothetical protein